MRWNGCNVSSIFFSSSIMKTAYAALLSIHEYIHKGMQHNMNRNRYGKEITLGLFLCLFLTKSRKKALVLIYSCLQRLFLTAYISRLTTHLRRLDVCNCTSESSNKVRNGQKTKFLGPHNIHKCRVNSGSHRKYSAVYPLFLFHVHSSLVLHDISTFLTASHTFFAVFLPFETACTR